MAKVTINQDGTIAVTLSAQELGLAQLVLADQGADALTAVFNLWFTNKVRDVINSRFALLSPTDQANLIAQFAQAHAAATSPTPTV